MAKPGFYAVARGRRTGVFKTWAECEEQIKGYPTARYKKFTTLADAEEFVSSGGVEVDSSSSAQASSQKKSPTSTSTLSSESTNVPMKRSHSTSVRGENAESLEDTMVVYCDGACKGNGKVGSIAGIGVWWGNNDSRNISERCPGAQTNNRAELFAIARVLETTPRNSKALLIKTDSKYSIQCLTEWLQNWQRRNFMTSSGAPVANRGLIEYIAALLAERKASGQHVKFEHVYGHVGIEGNEGADRLANVGAMGEERSELNWKTLRENAERRMEERFVTKKVKDKPRPSPEPISDSKDLRPSQDQLSVVKTRSIAVGTESLIEDNTKLPIPLSLSEPQSLEMEECYGYTADDLLDPDELEAELAE